MRRGWHRRAGCARDAGAPGTRLASRAERATREAGRVRRARGPERLRRRVPLPPGTGPAARRTRSLPVTLLELFPRSAPAWFVAAWQLARWRPGGWSAVATCPGCCRRSPATCLRRLRLLFLLRLFGRPHSHSQDGLRDAAGDPRLHLLKEAVRFALVGDERVLLAVAAQVDTLAELLHRSEVLDPVRVDRSEEDPSLDRAGELLAELFFARFVCLLDDLGDAVAQLVLVA